MAYEFVVNFFSSFGIFVAMMVGIVLVALSAVKVGTWVEKRLDSSKGVLAGIIVIAIWFSLFIAALETFAPAK